MEQTQRLWLARKLYGGSLGNAGGGILPPTDPRLQDLTDEQLDLDLELYLMDHPDIKRKIDSYKDTDYEAAMREDLEMAPETPPPLPTDFAPVPYNDEGD